MADAGPPSFHGIVGRSAAMQELFGRIEQVAPLRVPVLIQGESGTGKELVASAVQRLSARSASPFEKINCADFTPELRRSELFGHERGAFSGAVAKKVGVLSVADGGTVFLDEVGELIADARAMMLRFLQSGEGRPVGGVRTLKFDVRVIAATHRDLAAEVRDGAFRADLYYRLRRACLKVPPLRQRREDIPLLVEHFRRQVNASEGLSVEGVTPEALARIENHRWPGNVRELEVVLEEAMIYQRGGWVKPEDLDLDTRESEGPAETIAPVRVVPVARPIDDRFSVALRRQAALRIAGERGSVTRRDLVREFGISGEQARTVLIALARRGDLQPLDAHEKRQACAHQK
jgi:DNA-binding NtrC family response regulator